MSTILSKNRFQYENKWLLLSEIQTEEGESKILEKKIKLSFISPEEAFKKEQLLLQKFDQIRIVKPIDSHFVDTQQYALPRGISLAEVIQENRLTLEEKLKVASDLLEIILTFNSKNLFFCDLSWHLFWYDLIEEQLYLLDTIMLIRTETIANYYKLNLGIESDMHSTAPEQTFQTASMPDIRSNYYSLGVILYALFTGEKPFDGKERLSIQHKHLSLVPIAPKEHKADLGNAFSDFVMKLLSKNPRDRYQSDKGLKWDFDQIKSALLSANQDIEFELGSRDFPLQFSLPEQLFFRKKEHETLLKKVKETQEGYKKIILLRGLSTGVGIDKILKDLSSKIDPNQSYIGQGTYSKNDVIPFGGIQASSSDFIYQIMLEDRNNIKLLKNLMEEALGNLSGVMVTFNKDFGQLFSSVQKFQELDGAASLNRFIYAYTEFLNLLTKQGKSIVLCLNNIQFADFGSLQLLEQLLKSSFINNLLLVVGFEERKEEENTEFKAFLDRIRQSKSSAFGQVEIEIENFSKAELGQMLHKLKIEPKDTFHDILFEQTKGNVQFIKQFFKELVANNFIKPNLQRQKWEANIEAIKKIDLSDDISSFLLERINLLHTEELDLLKVAAVIGQKFKINQLERITNFDTDTTHLIIDNLRSKGFVVPLAYQQAKLSELEFAHPDFLPIIKNIITATEYAKIKLQLANELADKLDASANDIRLYELMNHLLPVNSKKCVPFKEYIFQAARKARNESAFATAGKYFEKLIDIDVNVENEITDSTFDYAYEACNCAIFDMKYEQYERLLDQLHTFAKTENQKYRIYLLKATAYMQREEFQKVLDNLVEGLNDMGIRFSAEISTLGIIKTFFINVWKTRNIDKDIVTKIPFNQDERLEIYERLIAISSGAVYFIKPTLTSRLSQIGINDTLNSGITVSSTLNLVSIGFSMNSFSNMVERANVLSDVGIELLEKRAPDINAEVVLYFLYGAFVQHTSKPLSDCVATLEKYYKRGRECGNIYIAFYCLGINRWYMFLDGTPLTELSTFLEASHVIALDANQTLIDNYHRIIKSIIYELQRGFFLEEPMTDTGLPMNVADFEKLDDAALATVDVNFYMAQMIVMAASGKKFKDTRVIDAALSILDKSGHGTYNAVVQIFYCCYHLLKGGFPLSFKMKQKIKKYITVLKVRTEFAPFNYSSKYFLLKALEAKSKSKNKLAESYFYQAYHSVLEYENIWDKAMITEELAHFLLETGRKKAALQKMEESINAYQTWGATSVVNRLYEAFPELKKDLFAAVATNDENNLLVVEKIENQELKQVFQLSRTVLTKETLNTQLVALMDAVEELTSTQRSIFLVNIESDLKISSEKWRSQPIQFLDEKIDEKRLPLSLIQVVMRRKKIMLLENASEDQQFGSDPYLSENAVKSVLCIPFVKKDEIKAILYLENQLLDGVFNHQKIELVQALCMQVALSLDHSLLTEMLEEKLELRSRQIQQERDKSDELLRNILPEKVAKELKEKGKVKAKKHDNASVLFTDFQDFTKHSASMTANDLIAALDDCYRAFDQIVAKHGLEKIKTIGDAYMCAGGIPEAQENHETKIVQAALEMIEYIHQSNELRLAEGLPIMNIRAGIHSGPVTAGVVGLNKYAYDIWGPTVNIASRMESSSLAGKLNISGTTYLKVKDDYICHYRGKIKAKNVGEIDMYFVERKT